MVRTLGFHPDNRGSIPRAGAKKKNDRPTQGTIPRAGAFIVFKVTL